MSCSDIYLIHTLFNSFIKYSKISVDVLLTKIIAGLKLGPNDIFAKIDINKVCKIL